MKKEKFYFMHFGDLAAEFLNGNIQILFLAHVEFHSAGLLAPVLDNIGHHWSHVSAAKARQWFLLVPIW